MIKKLKRENVPAGTEERRIEKKEKKRKKRRCSFNSDRFPYIGVNPINGLLTDVRTTKTATEGASATKRKQHRRTVSPGRKVEERREAR